MAIFTANIFTLRRFSQIFLRVLLALLLVLILLYGLLQLSPVQTWVVGKVAKDLSEKLHTRVTVKKVDLHFFNRLILEGLMVEDRQKDTLLYAGTAKVNVNDWFFLKDRIALENIGLDDAIINMKRTDSVWNYQFLIDYFVSPEKSTGDKKALQIDFGESHFNRVRFYKKDGWIGQDMTAMLQKMDLYTDSVDIKHKHIAIRSVALESPVFSQRDYTGNRPAAPGLTTVLNKIPVVSAFKWNNSGWIVTVTKFEVKEGTFQNDKHTERDIFADRFDGQHIRFGNINGIFNDVHFRNDTLTARLDLRAKERSGFEVKKISADLRFTPELMEFRNLDLITNRSHLGNYYAMRYEAFNRNMSNFIHDVNLEANFVNSVLSSDDLAFFDPKLSTWKRTFNLAGYARGTVDNFSTRNMDIRTGPTIIRGDLAMRGLPDINNTFLDVHATDFRTNMQEIALVFPALRNMNKPAVRDLGNISYQGNFTGFLNDFVAYGTVNTQLGTITADLNMKLPAGGIPVYTGKLSTNGFQAGRFLRINNLGSVAFSGQVKGRGFTLDQLNTDFTGNVRRLDYNGYSYQQISIDGNFANKVFKGVLSANDPNLRINNLEGTLSLSGKDMQFNLYADVASSHFQRLGWAKENLSLAGLFSLNFSGNNIDNFLGTARVYNAVLQKDSTRLSFDSLTLLSTLSGGDKLLTIQSNELDASLLGNFRILELPDAFKVFLGKYYPSYIKLPSRPVSNQDFSFDIRTRHIDDYIGLFDNKLKGFNNAIITGGLKLDSYALNINADVPEFSYGGRIFRDVLLKGNGNRDTLFAELTVGDIQLNDSLHLPDTRINLAAHNDVSVIKLNTSAGETLSSAELNTTLTTLSDGVRLHFSPSSFVLNDKRWELRKDGEITIRKNYIDANEVTFVHDNQHITISTELDDVTNNTHLVARLQQVEISDFAPFVITQPKLEGLLTGTATIRDPFGKTFVEFNGVADSFRLNDKYLGRVLLDGSANTQTGEVRFKTNANEADYVFNIEGSLNYKDSLGSKLDIALQSDRFNMDFLEPYLGSVFNDISGIAKTNLKVSGSSRHPYLTGDATISNGSVKIAYTQCRYLFDNQTIQFRPDEIDLGQIKLRDTLNHTGTLSGKMHHKFFKDFSFENMRFETPRMLVLNTTKKDNSSFYGNVIGRASMSMNGPITNLYMTIDGEPGINDSSHIYLPTGTTKETNAVDYIEFIQFGTEMDTQFGSNQAANIVLDMNLTANPACQIDVILDEETGDIIKGRGNGQLSIRVGNREPLNMRGRYDITKGEYTFNFQTFLRKPFTLNRGSITWNGDPYEAVIDMDAEYLAKNVDLSSISNSQIKEDITILSHLTGSLKKPVISFDFELPEKSELNRDYLTVSRLRDFKNDENVMNKQVASLLLFNSFISDQQNFLSQENTIAFATNTIGGVISGWLTNIFNKELEKATKGVISTYIDINPTLNLQNTASQLQANVRAGLKILLSSRVNILIGGNLDYNNPYTQLDRKGLFTPDITIEWLLNKDGSLRVVGFNRTSVLDPTTGQRNRSGVQLSFRKDFNKLSDIFKKRKK